MEIYDAVVIATGMAKDRELNINEKNKTGYFGATEFVNWYNGHPEYQDLNPNLKHKFSYNYRKWKCSY